MNRVEACFVSDHIVNLVNVPHVLESYILSAYFFFPFVEFHLHIVLLSHYCPFVSHIVFSKLTFDIFFGLLVLQSDSVS